MKRCWLSVLGAPCLMALLSTVTMPGAMPGQAAKPKKEPAAQPAGQSATPQSATPQSATPQTRPLGTIGAWSAYASGEKAGRICYLVGRPQKADSAGVARKAPVAMVTHRPSENISNVVSFVEGYSLKSGSDVALEIDDKKFDLFTNDDSAWARTADLDRTIVLALASGRTATVKGTPNAGKPTTDTYSLAGFAKALALIDGACGISRPEIAGAQAAPVPQKVAAPQKVSPPQKASAKRKTAVRKTSHKPVKKASQSKKPARTRH